ncbi:MAG: hypothetical protein LBD10_14705 [Desulfobulbus sp.]|jgi:uncharacterized coiled-coil protein SlyX|uniref:hypothetical protein n=1 Tax=Desulfobulbus sp. TaxID=895 RepID=UPI00284C771A|nr:hypothetical protein [Desulfobulbus sp.]MDR2551438.1 hypothetical protein [Desulfobulbus sp.]
MSIDYTAWRFWIDMGQAAATLIVCIYVWWDRRQGKTMKRFADLEKRQAAQTSAVDELVDDVEGLADGCARHTARTDALDKQHLVMQSELRHLPSKGDFDKLSDQIGSLTEKLGTLDGRLGGINRAVDLLNQHHLRIGR